MTQYRDINDNRVMSYDEWITEMHECGLDIEASKQLVDDDIRMGVLQEVK